MKKIKPYGKYITIDNKKMYVSVTGQSDEVILLLPDLGSVCPIIEMKALTSYLNNKYTVVTIEYLGYGMSDNASIDRSVENIVNDIHAAMQVMNFNSYSIAGHSMAGLYCLLYLNKYSDEVKNFIGIDTSVPQQIEYANKMELMLVERFKQYESRSIFLPLKTRFSAKKFLKNVNDFAYSKNDITAYGEMAVRALNHGSVISELQNARLNFKKMQDVKYPDKVNVLLIIASKTIKQFPNWLRWHKEVLNAGGRVEIIDGDHILHIQNPKLIAEKIDSFISKNNK